MERQSPEDGFATRPELNHDLAPIAGVGTPPHQASGHEPIDEPHDTVMMKLQSLSERADGGRPASFQTLQLQEQLIMPGRDADLPGGQLPDSEEPPHLIPKIGQLVIVRQPDRRSSRHARQEYRDAISGSASGSTRRPRRSG